MTTIVLAMDKVIEAFKTSINNLQPVFDPDLIYDSGQKLLRSKREIDGGLGSLGNDILLYTRSSLRPSAKMGRRTHELLQRRGAPDANIADTYKAAYGEFEFRFALIATDPKSIENFEVDYILEEGLKAIKTVDIDLTEIDEAYDITDLPYHIEWLDLEDLTVTHDGSFYKSLSGTAIVTGIFLSFPQEVGLIEEIHLKVASIPHNSAHTNVDMTDPNQLVKEEVIE